MTRHIGWSLPRSALFPGTRTPDGNIINKYTTRDTASMIRQFIISHLGRCHPRHDHTFAHARTRCPHTRADAPTTLCKSPFQSQLSGRFKTWQPTIASNRVPQDSFPVPRASGCRPGHCICVCGHLQYDVLLTHTSDPSLIDYTAG